MSRRFSTTSIEFLESETGKAFAEAMVTQYIDANRADRADYVPQDNESDFQQLLDDFMNLVGAYPLQFEDEQLFRHELETTYRERFMDHYPAEKQADRVAYVQTLSNVIAYLLVPLTRNIWLLDNGLLPDYPVKRHRKCSAVHLHWAREAAGWWSASLANVCYHLRGKPPCVPTKAAEVIAGYMTKEQCETFRTFNPNELEKGCPTC